MKDNQMEIFQRIRSLLALPREERKLFDDGQLLLLCAEQLTAVRHQTSAKGRRLHLQRK
jgi:hypothetical protein